MKSKLYPVLRALRKIMAVFGNKVTESYNSRSLTQRVIEGDLNSWDYGAASQSALSEYWELIHTPGSSETFLPSVLDFGGGGGRMGFHYVRNSNANWTVLETSEMTSAARDLLGEIPIKFVDDIDVLIQEGARFDALYCRSAFQYLRDPEAMLKRALDLTKKLVVLEEIVLHDGKNSVQMVQTSFLADNLDGSVRNWRDYLRVAQFPLTGISIEAFKRALKEEFEIIRFDRRPPASHLPTSSNFAGYDVVAIRKSI